MMIQLGVYFFGGVGGEGEIIFYALGEIKNG